MEDGDILMCDLGSTFWRNPEAKGGEEAREQVDLLVSITLRSSALAVAVLLQLSLLYLYCL